MADALEIQDAPSKKTGAKVTGNPEQKKDEVIAAKPLTKEDIALSQQYDYDRKYMFELAEKNLERELPVYDMVTKRPTKQNKFKPFRNIIYTSQIVWNGQRRNIRYYDGCTSIFTDEQPKDKETVDQLCKQTKPRAFLEGKFGCFGDERMLLLYLNICSWNTESEFRTRTADSVFLPSNREKTNTLEEQKLNAQEEALTLAKKATQEKMLMHASYLGIPSTDYDSGNELTPAEIRIEYRKKALADPDKFIESYGNKKIEVKYYIDKALESGLIHNKGNANKAMWKNNTVICDISGLKSNEAIANKLFEHSNMEEGEEFAVQLKALFN